MTWLVVMLVVWALGATSYGVFKAASRGRVEQIEAAVEEERADAEWEVAASIPWCECGSDLPSVPVVRGSDTFGGDPYVVAALCPACRDKRQMLTPAVPAAKPDRQTPHPEGPAWEMFTHPGSSVTSRRLVRTGPDGGPPTGGDSDVFGMKPKRDPAYEARVAEAKAREEGSLFDRQRYRDGWPRVIRQGEYLWRLPGRPETLCPVVDGHNTHDWTYVMDGQSAEPLRSVCRVCNTMRTRRGVTPA